jgi:hypothetical protein
VLATPGLSHQELEPQMQNDRMPSISLGIIVPVGAYYDGDHHWPNDAGVIHASVRFDVGGYSCGHIQGEPAALRELAAALIQAADRADHSNQLGVLTEGVAG